MKAPQPSPRFKFFQATVAIARIARDPVPEARAGFDTPTSRPDVRFSECRRWNQATSRRYRNETRHIEHRFDALPLKEKPGLLALLNSLQPV